jgi:quercetin dioxygenase-like cupin family protein
MDEYGLRARSMSVPACKRRVAVLVEGEETRDVFALIETVEAKRAQVPFDLHDRKDDALYVLEGFLNVWVAGRWVDVPAGTAVFLPRGEEHAFVVATETARMLLGIPASCRVHATSGGAARPGGDGGGGGAHRALLVWPPQEPEDGTQEAGAMKGVRIEKAERKEGREWQHCCRT